jgi:uncharacterized protein YneF (UPF0154 family)
MKSLSSSSIFTANNSVMLIIFVFIFIAIGVFFLIQKTTEKQNKDKSEEKNKIIEEKMKSNSSQGTNGESSGVSSNIKNSDNMNNADNNDSYNTDYNTVSETFQDEIGLFIKKDETRPEMYSHNPVYIPPFNTGKETRCVGRQINKPNETNNVQSCANSDLVKVSSDASY